VSENNNAQGGTQDQSTEGAGLTAEETARARSWQLELLATALPDTDYRDEGTERRYLAHGGLFVSLTNGAWYSTKEGRGGYSSVALIQLVKDGTYRRDDAVQCQSALNIDPRSASKIDPSGIVLCR
jgi:hypothetical protein